MSPSQYTDDTAVTHVDADDAPYDKDRGGSGPADEFGLLRIPAAAPGTPAHDDDYFDPWGNTLVASSPEPDNPQAPFAALLPPPRTARRSDLSSRSTHHHRTFSGGPSADMPLLASHARMDSGQSLSVHLRDSDITEFGLGIGLEPPATPTSMAGIGRRRFSSLGGSTLGSPHDEYSARTPSYYSSSHARTGSGASASANVRESTSLRESARESAAVALPIPIPVPAIAVGRAESGSGSEHAHAHVMQDASLNNSRTSEIGHGS